MRLRILFQLLFLALSPTLVFAAGKAEHVIILVWDGMRPDFITPEHAPTLYQLAQDGTFFANHHSSYCSATIVNGTAMATGLYPSRTGVIANSTYLPEIEPLRASAMQSSTTVHLCDEMTGGHYLVGPTLAETLQAAGMRTMIAGSKQVALLHDRKPRQDDATSINVFEGRALPPSALRVITGLLGRFPSSVSTRSEEPNEPRDKWTTRALLESLWTNGVPAFSLLWLSEPDFSQHAQGPGSAKALAAMKSSDRRLGEVLAELERRGVRDKTDVFVVSDHGFSTIERSFDVVALVRNAGFRAQRSFRTSPEPGEILVVGHGGSVFFYVIGRNREIAERLVTFLQKQEFTGTMFTREGIRGTFPLEIGKLDAWNPPDIVISMRWSTNKSDIGVPGVYMGDGGRRGSGGHASLSRFDLNNILVAAGPDIKKGFRNEIASGNTDLAPTILWLLGVEPRAKMDGRVLGEALTVNAPRTSKPKTRRLEASRAHEDLVWHQYLQVTEVNGTMYLDEGNAHTVRRDN